MPHDRRFRFGVLLSKAPSGPEWLDAARKAEDLGFSVLAVADHFYDQYAPIPALAAAAAVTSRLRLASLVLGVDFRHPAMVAKESATIDQISGGRFELGYGAGWHLDDYRWPGFTLDRAGVRIARLCEAIEVVRGLWGPGAYSHQGTHYQIDGLDSTPKPVQQPGPPLLMGGGGEKMLRAAARLADIVGVNPNVGEGAFGPAAYANMTAEATDAKLAWVREEAGSRFAELELCLLKFAVVISDDREAAATQVGKAFGGLTAEQVVASPHALVGSVDQLVDELQEQRTRWGASYVVLRAASPADLDGFAPLVSRLAGT